MGMFISIGLPDQGPGQWRWQGKREAPNKIYRDTKLTGKQNGEKTRNKPGQSH